MKLIVFGATGKVGLQLVKQALWKGHTVRAFGRNVFDIELKNEQLEIIKGALFDEGEVYDALKGCDAVLSSIGGSFNGADKTRSLGMKNIVAQMKKAGVKRIVALGNKSILNATKDHLILDAKDYPAEYLPVGNEHRKAYESLKESGLEWTFVCSPDIIDDGPTGKYITMKDYPPEPDRDKINSGDLAQFMLNELEKNEYVQSRVGISAT